MIYKHAETGLLIRVRCIIETQVLQLEDGTVIDNIEVKRWLETDTNQPCCLGEGGREDVIYVITECGKVELVMNGG